MCLKGGHLNCRSWSCCGTTRNGVYHIWVGSQVEGGYEKWQREFPGPDVILLSPQVPKHRHSVESLAGPTPKWCDLLGDNESQGAASCGKASVWD